MQEDERAAELRSFLSGCPHVTGIRPARPDAPVDRVLGYLQQWRNRRKHREARDQRHGGPRSDALTQSP